ncbi:P-loop containing nucleoside triphosphate hydrolase protein [Baffinella frigidus]|nr:P-loop containing nucleoside triphosphate hydrolase protein [Cryptophyta sp. CCMP2293]
MGRQVISSHPLGGAASVAGAARARETRACCTGFDAVPLDDRLRKAIAHVGWVKPTDVQAKALPLALKGKDVIAKARTGSGKTGAYALPILQKILSFEGFNQNTQMTRTGPAAVVLVPSRELVEQVRQAMVAQKTAMGAQKAVLAALPHVVVSTPARLAQHLAAGSVKLRESLEVIVLDEADLLLSFGFEADIKAIAGHLPNVCQAMLMSATLSEDLDVLKGLVMHNPVTLQLEDQTAASGQLSQHARDWY